jgi:hypothetical protein
VICALFWPACRDAPLPTTTPPTFVKAKAASSISDAPVRWKLGEQWAWAVSWRGLRVGTARLGVVGEENRLRVESQFHTVGMANEVSPLQHQLTTQLGAPNGQIDDIHTALGRLRSWAHPRASPAILALQYDNRRYLVDFAQPVVDRISEPQRLRIDGRARSGSTTIELTIWLSLDHSRTPLLLTLIHERQQVIATLIPSES